MVLTKASFEHLRKTLFKTLTQAQVDNLNALVRDCNAAGMSYPEAAYTLATVYHETGLVLDGKLYRSMAPVIERGSITYLKSKPYYPFIGYGFVQLTWEDNYRRVGKLLGVDLIADPSRALSWPIASKIMTQGMLQGWFTGVGFRRKRPVGRYDRKAYIAARTIINGTDKAADIADYAMEFEKALRS